MHPNKTFGLFFILHTTMKKLLFAFFLASFFLVSQAQSLTFNKDGKFKIVQFTDVHYIADDSRSAIALECIGKVIDAEHPDLVIFTGDVIYGKPAKKSMMQVVEEVSKRKCPFAVTFGNHDDEFGVSRKELLDLLKDVPYNLTTTTEGIAGVTNYILPVYGSKENKVSELLYIFDSHSYSKIEGIGGYGFIEFDQIAWYREQSRQFTSANNNVPVNALAFFHIPLPEYNMANTSEEAQIYGIRREKACSPQLNSGLFAAIKQMGDVRAIFVGHDHNNDYAVMWQNVLLAYGRYTGGDTVYNDLTNGARVIELTEGTKTFKTYIRNVHDQIEQEVVYPDSYVKRKR